MYLGSTRLRAAGGRGCFAKMRQGNMPWSAFCGRSSCRILSTSPVIPGGAKDLAVLSAGYAPCHLERSERSIPSATPTQTGHKNPPIRARFGFFLNPGTKSALFVPALDRIISCSRKAQRVRVRVLSKGYRLRLPLRFDPEGAANTLQSILKGRCPAPSLCPPAPPSRLEHTVFTGALPQTPPLR